MSNIPSSSAELRAAFLNYFEGHGHQSVHSGSLIPAYDPTLMFVNAGMVPFKDVFLGLEQRDYTRATSSQRCVRAGGKHNDLENVGYTARHHTFFEMLGNFSFGDYFKREAINYGWKFLTDELQIPAEKLWITVFEEDDEAADIWLNEVGVSEQRFGRIGAKDNFWSMGDTGPCGPCTEIFYDHGEHIAGGPPGSPDEDGDRYVEIWNLVFMQYNRDKSGTLTPLPKPSVDTGMGLERLAAVLQGVPSNYDTDLFKVLIQASAKAIGVEDEGQSSLRVVADHIRSCAFLVVDGVLPSNEGRGYVLRRIIRRALRHGHQLGASKRFFYRLVQPLVELMGEAYPELAKAQEQVERVLRTEEERFAETLEQGMKIFELAIADLQGDTIPGEVVFKLYDTYGFPADLTADVARERNLSVDMAGFEAVMEDQRQRARAASQFDTDYTDRLGVDQLTEFSGYEHLEDQAQVLALFKDGQRVETLSAADNGWVILDKTPCYAESGGQVGDTGIITAADGKFTITDTKKRDGGVFTHIGQVSEGELKVGERVGVIVDAVRRRAVVGNHSATHLMHAALREVLGDHVQQKGSLVDPERLRFDFSHFEPMTGDQIRQVEKMVNQQIRDNAATDAQVMAMDKALESGAMALFDEKYGDEVRVINIGFSTELCGGTHVQRAGDIGLFKVLSESGVASGVRRIEATSGALALASMNSLEDRMIGIAGLLKSSHDGVEDKVAQLIERSKRLEKELEGLQGQLASSRGDELADLAVEVDGIKVLASRIDGADVKVLRETLDQVKNKLGQAAVVLASVEDGKVRLVAGVSKAETKRVKAGDLVNSVASQVGGRGGGRPDMAQAGGDNPENLDAALASVADWVRQQVAGDAA